MLLDKIVSEDIKDPKIEEEQARQL